MTKPLPELRDPQEVLKEISELLSRSDGVQGFTITTRTKNATLKLQWGDNRIRKNWPVESPYYKDCKEAERPMTAEEYDEAFGPRF